MRLNVDDIVLWSDSGFRGSSWIITNIRDCGTCPLRVLRTDYRFAATLFDNCDHQSVTVEIFSGHDNLGVDHGWCSCAFRRLDSSELDMVVGHG